MEELVRLDLYSMDSIENVAHQIVCVTLWVMRIQIETFQ